MPTPLTPAPTQQPLVGSMTLAPASAWWTWYDLLWRYVVGFSMTSIADTAAQTNVSYIAGGATLVTYTLPTALKVNDTVQVLGKGAGGWRIQLNTGQTIHGTSSTSSGGSLSSTNRYNTVTLKVITQDTELVVVSQVGTLTYA